MKGLLALGLLLALVALAGCSTDTVRVLHAGDPLRTEGLQVDGVIHSWADARHVWWLRYRMPFVMPFSPASVRSLKVSVGTQGNWLLSQETGLDLEPPPELPEAFVIEHAEWHIRAYNDEGAVEFTKLVPVDRLLVRDACTEPSCAFALENDADADDLFSFSLTAADLLAIPPSWPRPLAQFIVETALTLRVRPQEVVFGHRPGPPLTLRVFLTGGNSVLYLAPK